MHARYAIRVGHETGLTKDRETHFPLVNGDDIKLLAFYPRAKNRVIPQIE